MKSSSLLSTILLATASSASPFGKREVGGVLICTGANATGQCSHQVYTMEECHQLPAPYYQNTNTFAPDGEAFSCFPRVYDCGGICKSPTGCTFGGVDFAYENKYNLGAIQWDTLIKSFDCSLKRG